MATKIPQPAMQCIVAQINNRMGRDPGSTSGCPVVQLGTRLCNRNPVRQPASSCIHAEHIQLGSLYFGNSLRSFKKRIWMVIKFLLDPYYEQSVIHDRMTLL